MKQFKTIKAGEFIFILLFLFVTASCSQSDLEKKNKRLLEELEIANERLDNLELWINDLREQIDIKDSLYESEYKRLNNVHQDLIKSLEDEINKGEIKINKMKDALKLNIADKIFFDSGETKIKTEGMEVLKKIGKILKMIPEKMIRIEGHTDDVPVGSKLKGKYETNWELSSARAINVVRYLHEVVKISPSRLSAVSYSQYSPVSSNKSAKGRAKNRRIEIVLINKHAIKLMGKEQGIDKKKKKVEKKKKS